MKNIESVKTYLLALQNRITAALEQIDGGATFRLDAWETILKTFIKLFGEKGDVGRI